MLAFIDESGHPHPHDPNQKPVIAAVCMNESDSRRIAGMIHAMKRDVLQREQMEIKGRTLLNRRTFRRKPDHVAFVEEFFNALANMPISVFAIVMERPSVVETWEDDLLPRQFQFLIERIQLLASERDEMATVMFDGHSGLLGGLSQKFNSFLYRSQLGRAWTNITDAPLFVDSKSSAGIQIADMVASVIRQHEESELYRQVPPGDHFLLAIRRYYRIIGWKTVDQTTPSGDYRHGIYRLSPTQ